MNYCIIYLYYAKESIYKGTHECGENEIRYGHNYLLKEHVPCRFMFYVFTKNLDK